jgi:hypothetical protein
MDAWFDNLNPELRKGIAKRMDTGDSNTIEIRLQELKAKFPKGYANVMTHGDLHLGNIIVNNGEIEAVIDWEVAGFYPSWVESYLLSRVGDYRTAQLVELLWENGCLDFSYKDLKEKIYPGLRPVTDTWKCCKVEHPDHFEGWYKPGFCECKNYGGLFRWHQIGKMPEHRIVD